MKHHKVGSIYTDMIKPLEKEYYRLLSRQENIRRKALDRQNPHLQNVYYEDTKLQEMKELRSLVPFVSAVAVHFCLSKDIPIGRTGMRLWKVDPPKDAALMFDMFDSWFFFLSTQSCFL